MSEISTNEAARYKVDVAGTSFTQADSKGLTALVVEDHVDMMGVMRVTIDVKGGFDASSVRLGDEAKAAFGGAGDDLFKGFVTGIRHHARAGNVEFVTIIAMDALCKLGASRHTRIFEEVTDSDIVSSVLGEAGLSPGTVDSTSGQNKYVIQRNESDLTFLKRLAARNGYLLLGNNEGKVDFKKVQYSGAKQEFGRQQIQQFDYTVTHQTVPPSVKVLGWSYVDKEKVEGTASAASPTIGGGASAVSETGTIWQADLYVTDVHVADEAAARSMAESELNRLARGYVRGSALVEGTGEVRAGKLIKFKEFATGFNPEAYVVSSRHFVEAGVYKTEFHFIGNTKPT